jgi:transposase InsO family protein
MGAPRMHEELGYEGETASLNRIARLMSRAGLFGVPQKRRRRNKPSGARPAYVRKHLERASRRWSRTPSGWWTSHLSGSAKGGCICAQC